MDANLFLWLFGLVASALSLLSTESRGGLPLAPPVCDVTGGEGYGRDDKSVGNEEGGWGRRCVGGVTKPSGGVAEVAPSSSSSDIFSVQ